MDKTERLRARASTDPQLRAVLRKIADGRADFKDTASYSIRFSQILGDVLSDGIIDSPDRVQDCKDLLRLSYDEINSLLTQVQSALDEQAGVRIAPQHEKFPEERVEKVARSLIDPTVSDETVVRRASNAASNVSASFHDDYIRRNAQFRSDLGLRTYIVRTVGSKACDWCAELSGKYEYRSEPKDVYRRHDNCTCTVTYESGRTRQDVWSKRTWMHTPDYDPNQHRPTVLTPEQANEVERRARERFSSLTSVRNSDRIRNIRLDNVTSAVANSQIRNEVANEISDTLRELNAQYLFDDVAVLQLDPKIVMQTDPIRNVTFFDTRLNLNDGFWGGKSLEQINEEIMTSNATVANSLREAVIHEIYHAKLISGLNQAELEALYDILSDYHIEGISKIAYGDGSECIAELGVLFERGETEDIPQTAKELFNQYIGGMT